MKYYVHTLTDNQNDHEVHTETCFRLPDANNRKELGEFSSCEPAVKAAKNLGYTRVNGCYWCC
ncbi:hypothetical protein, partial [Escherichia coli]